MSVNDNKTSQSQPYARFDAAVGQDETVTRDFYSIPEGDDTPKAAQILNDAVATMVERGKSYDKDGNGAERSMDKIVAMFYALTGIKMTPAQGYKFMACLKLPRSEQGLFNIDNFLDGAAYMALAGEAADLEVSE